MMLNDELSTVVHTCHNKIIFFYDKRPFIHDKIIFIHDKINN